MTDKAALPDAWSPSGKPRGTRDWPAAATSKKAWA